MQTSPCLPCCLAPRRDCAPPVCLCPPPGPASALLHCVGSPACQSAGCAACACPVTCSEAVANAAAHVARLALLDNCQVPLCVCVFRFLSPRPSLRTCVSLFVSPYVCVRVGEYVCWYVSPCLCMWARTLTPGVVAVTHVASFPLFPLCRACSRQDARLARLFRQRVWWRRLCVYVSTARARRIAAKAAWERAKAHWAVRVCVSVLARWRALTRTLSNTRLKALADFAAVRFLELPLLVL